LAVSKYQLLRDKTHRYMQLL